jgi:GTP-binding protein HflX
MNLLTDAGVLAEDRLFATLGTTTRKLTLPSGTQVMFTDTIGFIQKLPHHLIKAFRATLEELNHADILVHVIDASNPSHREQTETVYNTLTNLGVADKPIITIFNKTDLITGDTFQFTDEKAARICKMSAKHGNGKDELLNSLEETVRNFKQPMTVLIPFSEGRLVGLIHKNCEITKEEHTENGTLLNLFADEEMRNRLKGFTVSSPQTKTQK